ncbi:Gustatory receptor 90 [Frankliniella occidentalis]|nr:Gustatory receptor 90 [Frankliniella occidentalis]
MLWHVLAQLLRVCGMLPLRGPILLPRPLGYRMTCTVSVFAFIFSSPVGYYSVSGLGGRRRELCTWVHCMSLYCLRHPPSTRAWRGLLVVAVVFTVGWLGIVLANIFWMSFGVSVETSTVRRFFKATGICPVVLQIYILLFVGPVALTTVLTADIRRECERIISSGGARKILLNAEAKKVILHLYCSAFIISDSIIATTNHPGDTSRSLVPAVYSTSHNILFILLCYVAQRMNDEQTKLSERVRWYLSLSPSVPSAVRSEIQCLMFSVRVLRKRFAVLGIFSVDSTLLKTVLGAILTHVVVLHQFGAVFSQHFESEQITNSYVVN